LLSHVTADESRIIPERLLRKGIILAQIRPPRRQFLPDMLLPSGAWLDEYDPRRQA